jgi:hypothetical protein
MTKSRLLWLGAVAIVAVAGFLAGWAVKGGGKADFAFDTSAPVFTGADLPQGRSRAGFTGFNETGGLDGATIVAGKVTSVGTDSLALATAAGTSTIRITGEQKLRILQPYAAPIPNGATVVVTRKATTDEAQSLLLILDP